MIQLEEINQKVLLAKERRLKRYRNRILKQHQQKILPASRRRMYEDTLTTGCKGSKFFGAKYGNGDIITEKPNG